MGAKSRAARELGLITGGKLLGLGSLLVCGVLVARATGPEQYGIYAAALTLILLLDATIGSPLDWAMVRFGALHRNQPGRVAGMLGAIFRLKVLVALLLLGGLTLLLLTLPAATTALLGPLAQGSLLLVVLLSTLGLLALRGTAAYLQVELHFVPYALLDGLVAVVRLSVILLLMGLGVAVAGPYVAVYGGSAGLAFLLALKVIPQPYLAAPRLSREDLLALLRFLGASAGIIVLGTITGRTDLLFLSVRHSAEAAGFYAAAVHLAAIATMLDGWGNWCAGICCWPGGYLSWHCPWGFGCCPGCCPGCLASPSRPLCTCCRC